MLLAEAESLGPRVFVGFILVHDVCTLRQKWKERAEILKDTRASVIAKVSLGIVLRHPWRGPCVVQLFFFKAAASPGDIIRTVATRTCTKATAPCLYEMPIWTSVLAYMVAGMTASVRRT